MHFPIFAYIYAQVIWPLLKAWRTVQSNNVAPEQFWHNFIYFYFLFYFCFAEILKYFFIICVKILMKLRVLQDLNCEV
jgi:hypothetical protein